MKMFALKKYANGYKLWECTEEYEKVMDEIDEIEKAFGRMSFDDFENYRRKRLKADIFFPAENEEMAEKEAEFYLSLI